MEYRQTEYTANLHVHTTYSDGTESIDRVIEAAQTAGLDILLLNDHDSTRARQDGYHGYHGNLLVLVGFEISGPHNHYLVFGLDEPLVYDWNDPQDFIDRVSEAGGIGFVAHPFEKGSPLSDGGRAFTWTDWDVNGFNGLEIWNHSSSWKTNAQTYASGIYHYFLKNKTLPGPDKETLAKWDELGQKKRVAGVGGSDVHAYMARVGPLRFCIFPYEYSFRAVNTHILLPQPLTGDLEADEKAVLNALAQGSSFLAFDRIHSGKGFDFYLENNNGRRAGQGEETTFQNGDALVWRLPVRARARLKQNGMVALDLMAGEGKVQITTPGVYRLEVFRPQAFFGDRPWIYSNPIYVR